MSYKNLRTYMKRISPPVDHNLKDCDLVIDGRSFFKNTYKNSGCQSILGGEYDRYAVYLKGILEPFKKSGITCHIIFNGAMEASLERRLEIHQKVIKNAKDVNPADPNAYCEPILSRDVWKEVLDELEIKHYVTEKDSWEAIFFVANELKCPILTENYEYALNFNNNDFVNLESLDFDKKNNNIKCKIFKSTNVLEAFRVVQKALPLFFTLLDESKPFSRQLAKIMGHLKGNEDILDQLLKWTRWAVCKLDDTLQHIEQTLSQVDAQEFRDAYESNKKLSRRKINKSVVKNFRLCERNGYLKVPVIYVNLISNGTVSGSWFIFDKEQEDAMLPALDIIFYGCDVLESQRKAVTFIGRQNEKSSAWEVENSCNMKDVDNPNLFMDFLLKKLPGLDMKLMEDLPEECWILILTLVYYRFQKKLDSYLAYSIILSYIMIGPVSNQIGVIKPSNVFVNPNPNTTEDIDLNGLSRKDCTAVANSLMDLFYAKKLERRFDRKILHSFAEFQHCLQHMNYLNFLCGGKIQGTTYNKSLNMTFAYNMYNKIKDKSDLRDVRNYIEKKLKKSTLSHFFEKIVSVYETCLRSVCVEEVVDELKHLKTSE